MYVYIYIYKDIYLFSYLFIYLYPDETVPQRKPQGYISRIYSLGRGSIFPFDVWYTVASSPGQIFRLR